MDISTVFDLSSRKTRLKNPRNKVIPKHVPFLTAIIGYHSFQLTEESLFKTRVWDSLRRGGYKLPGRGYLSADSPHTTVSGCTWGWVSAEGRHSFDCICPELRPLSETSLQDDRLASLLSSEKHRMLGSGSWKHELDSSLTFETVSRNMVIKLKVPGIRREAGVFQQEPIGQPICVSGGSPVSHRSPFLSLRKLFRFLFQQSQMTVLPG